MSAATKSKFKKPAPAAATPDFPYVLRLRDGRRIYVEVPAKWVTQYEGELAFKAEGAAFLDRVRALATRVQEVSTPGHIRTLREALSMTQRQLGEALGVDKLTVSRWERGQVKPGAASVKRLRKLQDQAAHRGVMLGRSVA